MSLFTKWCNLRWLRILSLLSYYIWPRVFFIIFTFQPTGSSGYKRIHFDVNSLVDSERLTNFTILTVRTFHFPSPTSSCQKAACRATFGILLWANLSWFWEAGGPLTPAQRLSLCYLPAACCHGYPGSVAGQCSTIEIYDTTSPSRNTSAFCVAVIISLLDAFCSPHQVPLRLPACLGQHGGNDRSHLLVHMCVLAIWQMDLYLHHQTTFSQITACSGICIYEQSVQTDSSRKTVMVWLMCPWRDDSKYWGKNSQTLVEMEILQMFEMKREGDKEFWLTLSTYSPHILGWYSYLVVPVLLKYKKMRNEVIFLWLSWIEWLTAGWMDGRRD